tara:strand:+ start:215 stop:433 length:219 start_codon:yes stop_codon:yes gene_type:complete
MTENIPDKQTYQINRRRMCWSALTMMLVMLIAMLVDPVKYGDLAAFDMAFMSLSGLVAVYFGATSYTQAKRK